MLVSYNGSSVRNVVRKRFVIAMGRSMKYFTATTKMRKQNHCEHQNLQHPQRMSESVKYARIY